MLHELYKKNKVYTAFLKSEKEDFFCGLFTIAGNMLNIFFQNLHQIIIH